MVDVYDLTKKQHLKFNLTLYLLFDVIASRSDNDTNFDL